MDLCSRLPWVAYLQPDGRCMWMGVAGAGVGRQSGDGGIRQFCADLCFPFLCEGTWSKYKSHFTTVDVFEQVGLRGSDQETTQHVILRLSECWHENHR